MAAAFYKKRDLLGVIASMEKLNDTVISSSNPTSVISAEVLGDCQELAIEIGTFLETEGDRYVHIVRILEAYCEGIYQLSMVLTDAYESRRIAREIQGVLIELADRIKQDLPKDKKEVVFLPYKASMWDSLESVWMAADADPDCDAYVIPIPYFDRNSDGSFGEMHWDGDLYPSYVPITSWLEYDIPERRPDIIFFHNPYDDLNFVISVHPAFYASELYKHTDQLVYIPYFVGINDTVPDRLITLNGVLYAHKVIVQSENVKQDYIKAIRKLEKEHNCEGMYGDIENKILPLGSPKYDKVMGSKAEDYDIPEEWARLIVREDGTRKKVILYNTTVHTLLNTDEKMITKIENVLKVFRANDDVVLLWRPHPLYKETISSMRERLLSEYTRIEKEYIEGGWGIYDDTADLNRAIALSDAYYGDWSSVVDLYKKTGKPIMIQDVNILE
ncbi:MAG: CDP-glycerol glycerophosphotransferase family protein [Lachnospiraceae bacterium]|nr:CDP-glycerol glycerophosphotransferase family protein [Lachnospiraceae bacterium]